MHKYIEKVDPILHKLALTDIICFIKILNSLTKNKFISIYNKAFSLIYQKVIFADSYKANAVNEDDRMTYPKFKFLLNSLTGCIKIAENNHNIRAVVYDQLVREFILINSRVNTRIKYPILWKFSENFLQILSKSRVLSQSVFRDAEYKLSLEERLSEYDTENGIFLYLKHVVSNFIYSQLHLQGSRFSKEVENEIIERLQTVKNNELLQVNSLLRNTNRYAFIILSII